MEPLDVGLGKAEAQAEIDRYSRNEKAVLISALMMASNCFQPIRQAVFIDRIRNQRAGALRGGNVDWGTGGNRRKHRSQCGLAGKGGCRRRAGLWEHCGCGSNLLLY